LAVQLTAEPTVPEAGQLTVVVRVIAATVTVADADAVLALPSVAVTLMVYVPFTL
jgi:precorrin-4 methylase